MGLGESSPDNGVEVRDVNALTGAEKQVCELAAMGLTNRQIAEARCVGVKAVEFHLHNAFVKLNVSNRTQLTRYLLKHEAIDHEPSGASVEHTSDAPGPSTTPVATTPNEVEHVAEQTLSEVLEAVSSEIGGRDLSDAELARLHNHVASEVAEAVALRFGLAEPQRATLQESLREQLRVTHETDTLAS